MNIHDPPHPGDATIPPTAPPRDHDQPPYVYTAADLAAVDRGRDLYPPNAFHPPECDCDLCRGADPHSPTLATVADHEAVERLATVAAEARQANAHVRQSARNSLGRVVRKAWVEWAKEQPNPKPHWLLPYEALGWSDQEADCRIGESVVSHVLAMADKLPDDEPQAHAFAVIIAKTETLLRSWASDLGASPSDLCGLADELAAVLRDAGETTP